MRKLKRILCLFVPMALVLVFALGVILPLGLKEDRKLSLKTIKADESGASSADKSKKGGAIYLEEGATYTMTGGTIENRKNIYGGAVYVSNKATFTMNGGTIQNCRAMYGGAIYIANGGTVVINGGKILNNTAEKAAPAIYVEEGGKLTIGTTSVVDGNKVDYYTPPLYIMGEEETMGGTANGVASTVKLKTIYFGSYPQTYVGDTMNTTLENWYSNQPAGQTYTIGGKVGSKVWTTYEYQGEKYVRGTSLVYGSYTYHDGTTVKDYGTAVWFKVEPIKWYILNYDAWQSGDEDIELLSELALASNIGFNASNSDGNNWKNSELQKWLNGDFYKNAFDANEQEIIAQTTVKNNVTNNYNSSTSDGSGTTTYDKVYCKSYWEVSNSAGVFKGTAANRLCSPTDFALSNYCRKLTDTRYTTAYYPSGGTCDWRLRSAGSASNYACYVDYDGYRFDSLMLFKFYGVRPALHLSI